MGKAINAGFKIRNRQQQGPGGRVYKIARKQEKNQCGAEAGRLIWFFIAGAKVLCFRFSSKLPYILKLFAVRKLIYKMLHLELR
jgi:hypothetical protein